MEISDEFLCLFSAEVEETEDRFVVEIPHREVENGTVEIGRASCRERVLRLV